MPNLQRLIFVAVIAIGVVITAGCKGDDKGPVTTTTGAPPPETTTTTEAPLSAGTQLFVYNPSVGDCFDKRTLDTKPTGGATQTDITLKLPCALPHQNEVFDVVEYPSTHDFPGETTLRDFAKKNCTRNFAAFVGTEYEVSKLEVGFVIPRRENWGPGRERIGCYLYDVTGDRLAGSMRGSAR